MDLECSSKMYHYSIKQFHFLINVYINVTVRINLSGVTADGIAA